MTAAVGPFAAGSPTRPAGPFIAPDGMEEVEAAPTAWLPTLFAAAGVTAAPTDANPAA